MKNESNNRCREMDISKGFAIYLVILGHYIQCYSGSQHYYFDNSLYLTIYTFHMPLFMFISGCVFSRSLSRSNLRAVFIKRARQLLYPYCLWGAIVIVIHILLNYFAYRLSFIDTVFYTIKNTSLYWFLLSLFMSSSIAIICERIGNHISKKRNALMIIVWIIWFLTELRERDVWMCLYFIIGLIISETIFKTIKETKTTIIVCALLISTSAMLISAVYLDKSSIQNISGYRSIMSISDIKSIVLLFIRAFLGITTVMCISILFSRSKSKNIQIMADGLESIGKNSLIIYLLQKCLVETIGEIFVLIRGEVKSQNIYLYSGIMFVISIFATMLISYIARELMRSNRIKYFLIMQ